MKGICDTWLNVEFLCCYVLFLSDVVTVYDDDIYYSHITVALIITSVLQFNPYLTHISSLSHVVLFDLNWM